jgi:hypothetical protein
LFCAVGDALAAVGDFLTAVGDVLTTVGDVLTAFGDDLGELFCKTLYGEFYEFLTGEDLTGLLLTIGD